MSTKAEQSDAGTWTFYVLFVLSVIFEGTLVHVLGLWWGGAVLLIGGLVFGLFSLKFTDPEKKARDPFFRASIWGIRRRKVLGYLILAVVLGGAPGTAVAYKKLGSPYRLQLTLLAAVLFASFWAPFFYFILK